MLDFCPSHPMAKHATYASLICCRIVQTPEGMTQLEASLGRMLAANRVQWKTPRQNIVQLAPSQQG